MRAPFKAIDSGIVSAETIATVRLGRLRMTPIRMA